MSLDSSRADLKALGRDPGTGGYRRFAWTREDSLLREWFAGECAARGLDLVTDWAGNQWGWWGDPDAAAARGDAGVVAGSHLDSVPDGGEYDGPLGVMSAFAALDALQAKGFSPVRPIGVANFVDEEGARFGVACAGSRLITGSLPADRARGLTDSDGITMAEAMARAGHDPSGLGRDQQTLRRIGIFIELHVEQGRALADLQRPVAVGSSIWPHGRWRFELAGEANHAGTTRLADRHDPMLALADAITVARHSAQQRGCVATVGKVLVHPNGVNAIPSAVTAWLDARGPREDGVRGVVAEVSGATRAAAVEESFTADTAFDPDLARRLSTLLDEAPVLATGAGHDAGVLSTAGVTTAMLFVRNPTGVSHSPAEFAERDDCLAGVRALTAVLEDLAGERE